MPASGQWWQSSVPRNAQGNTGIVREIHHEYAACVHKRIKQEWPYYKQLVAQNKCRHLYACCDASIDDCHHLQIPGGGVCHCQRWKQLWDQQVFENYKVGWHSESCSFMHRLMDIGDRYGMIGNGLKRNG